LKVLWALDLMAYCYDFFGLFTFHFNSKIEQRLEWPDSYENMLVCVIFIIGLGCLQFNKLLTKIIDDYGMMWLMWLISRLGINHISHNIIKSCATLTSRGLILQKKLKWVPTQRSMSFVSFYRHWIWWLIFMIFWFI